MTFIVLSELILCIMPNHREFVRMNVCNIRQSSDYIIASITSDLLNIVSVDRIFIVFSRTDV